MSFKVQNINSKLDMMQEKTVDEDVWKTVSEEVPVVLKSLRWTQAFIDRKNYQ